MTTEEKLKALQQSPEIIRAVKLLIVAFEDCELQSHIRFGYNHGGKKFEITFLPIVNEVTYSADKNE